MIVANLLVSPLDPLASLGLRTSGQFRESPNISLRLPCLDTFLQEATFNPLIFLRLLLLCDTYLFILRFGTEILMTKPQYFTDLMLTNRIDILEYFSSLFSIVREKQREFKYKRK